MRAQLDFDKSVKKHRLVFKLTTDLFFSRLLDNSLWFIFLACVCFLVVNKNNYTSARDVLFVSLFVILAIWLIVGLLVINKLVIIKGSNVEDNRRKIIQLLNDSSPNLILNDSGQKIIRYNLRTGLFNWGKQITIVFHEKNILMNITTFGRYEIRSPFHAIFHIWTIKQIIRQFERK